MRLRRWLDHASLAEAVAPGEVVGVDVQPAQIERARALAAERGITTARFEVGDVYELPFPDRSFDAAFAHTLLNHLPDPMKALREMRRVLKPGAVVGIADGDPSTALIAPPTSPLLHWHQLFERVLRHHGGHPDNAREYRRMLLDAGFSRPIASPTLTTPEAYGTPGETRAFAAGIVDQMHQPAFVDVVTGQGWADLATLESLATEILTWGERPPTPTSRSWGGAAVGWVGDH